MRHRSLDKNSDGLEQEDDTNDDKSNPKRRRLQKDLLLCSISSSNSSSNSKYYNYNTEKESNIAIPGDAHQQLLVTAKVVCHNNKAVELYSKGDFHNASSLFEKALTSLHTPFSDTIAHTTNNNKCHHNDDDGNGDHSYNKKSDRTNDSSGTPPTSAYMYQRKEFDEGLIKFSTTERIERENHPNSVRATVLFNIGQTRRKLGDASGASKCYNNSLGSLLPGKESVTDFMNKIVVSAPSSSSIIEHPIIIPILHNIAQLAYQNANIPKAIAFYKLALNHCQQLHGGRDLSVAITLNCMGVMHYHSSMTVSTYAIKFFQEALDIQRNVLGPNSKEEATTDKSTSA